MKFSSAATGWPLFCGLYTRLLVDLNRSTRLFHSKGQDGATREYIKQTYYQPFRSEVLGWIRRQISSGKRVIHISCHSFTPVLHGIVRPMDMGLLYDPQRKREREFAEKIIQKLRSETSMSVRANAPYKGVSDGHAAALRKQFSGTKYVGLEIEVNQSMFGPTRRELWRHVCLLRLIEALTQDTEE